MEKISNAEKFASQITPAINWRDIGRIMLQKTLPLNPLTTQPDDIKQEDPPFLMALTPAPKSEERWQPSDFFAHISQEENGKPPQRIAIIGESGTGKTLILSHFAQWLLEVTDNIPVWICPSYIEGLSLEQYLFEKWLSQAENYTDVLKNPLFEGLKTLIERGKLWILLDGWDFLRKAKGATPSLSSIATTLQQLQGWGQSVSVMVTCRTSTWQRRESQQAYGGIKGFDRYFSRHFTYPTEVNFFIEQWFPPVSSKGNHEWGAQLSLALAQAGQEPLQASITHPLRLALLCRLWQQHPGYLPDTVTQLYGLLIHEFYEWKAEITRISPQKQDKLHPLLAQLALFALEQPDGILRVDAKPFKVCGKDIEKPLLTLDDQSLSQIQDARTVGWLVRVESTSETDNRWEIYEWNEDCFAAYFAAQGISSASFFVDGTYPRFFAKKWQKVLFFWLGRSDISPESKESLIERLVNFQDQCGLLNVFGQQAFLLAVKSLAYFNKYTKSKPIIDKAIDWAFNPDEKLDFRSEYAKDALFESDRPLVIARLMDYLLRYPTHYAGFAYLEKIAIHNADAIQFLTEQLKKTLEQTLRWQIAETLGKIAPNNVAALTPFVTLLNADHSEDSKQVALNSLAKIGKNAPLALNSMIPLLHSPSLSSLHRRVFQCLEIIGQGHPTAIAALIQLIRTQTDPSLQRQAAESLEKIDPSNPTALAVLSQLLSKEYPEDIRRQAVYSLGEIELGNSSAIHALVKLLEESNDLLTQWVAISSIGKIGRDHREAIQILLKFVQSEQDHLLRKEAIESLSKIDPQNPAIISALVNLIKTTEDEAIRREAAESLGKLDPGNPAAIAALGYLLQSAVDEFTRRQAATSLVRIDPGNLEALTALVQLIKTSQNTDIQGLAAESLGELGANNPAVIATLIRLLQSNPDKHTFRRTAKSLGKIGKGNREVISTLMDLLKTKKSKTENQGNRLQLANSLIHILIPAQIPAIVTTLQAFFADASYLSDVPCQKLLWHCAQVLEYEAFEQAWHLRDITHEKAIQPILGDLTISDPDYFAKLQQSLRGISNLPFPLRWVFIDSGDFLERDNPAIDIYDQMLAQNCPEFSDGIPENLSKLRIYWQLLQRNQPETGFIFIFYENTQDGSAFCLAPAFLQILSKFHSRIIIITEQKIEGLTCFSPTTPQLDQKILEWLKNAFS